MRKVGRQIRRSRRPQSHATLLTITLELSFIPPGYTVMLALGLVLAGSVGFIPVPLAVSLATILTGLLGVNRLRLVLRRGTQKKPARQRG